MRGIFRATRIAAPLLWAATVLPAQSPPAPVESPDATLRITVRLVQVDVVVTDSKGRRVPDLSAGDFEILQDGVPQPVKTFVWNPAPPAPPDAQDSRGSKDRLPVGAPSPVTASDIKRTVALVVDDLSLSFPNMVRVRNALRTFIERQMQPGDLVAIVRTGGGVVALEQFTADRRMLLAAVDLLKWRFNGRCGMSPIAPLPTADGSAATRDPQVLDYGCAFHALGTVGTLQQIVTGMRRYAGRKSIVMLSNSLRVPSQLHGSMNQLTDLANRSAVSIYAVDPEGLRDGKHDADEEGSAALPGTSSGTTGLGGALADLADQARSMEDGLQFLSVRTGGMFYRNNNDIAGCIRQAADDQLGYYLLGYTPAEGTFERDPSGKPKFHKVVVRVHRPGLRVRWKTGFNGVPDELQVSDLEGRPKTREQQLAEALASPFTASAIRVRLTSTFTMITSEQGPLVRSMLHFDARDLNFARQSDGTWRTVVDIVMLAFRGINQTYLQSQRTQEIALPDDMYQKARREGFIYNLPDVGMKEPGPVIIRAVVRDQSSAKLGSASQILDIPDIRKRKFALSTVNLKLATPALLASLHTPTKADSDGAGEENEEGGLSTAVRQYRAGQSFIYGALIINPKVKGSQGKPKLTSWIRVFRNGTLIFATPPDQPQPADKLDDGRYLMLGLLRLGDKMIPGEYLLQVAVTDQNAGRRKTPFVQWIDFEVLANDQPHT